MKSQSTYSRADEATKQARRAPHQQAIADGLATSVKAFWAVGDQPEKAAVGDRPAKKLSLKTNPQHPFHKKKAADFGSSVAATVEVGQNDTKSLASAKGRMAPAANMAVVATLESQKGNKYVYDMMLQETVTKVKPDGGTNMFKSMGLKDEARLGSRTEVAKQEEKALEDKPLVYDYDGVAQVIKAGAGGLADDRVAFNTVVGMRLGVGVSNFGPLTLSRRAAIEKAGRAVFDPTWKLRNDASWIVAQRDQGKKNASKWQGKGDRGGTYQTKLFNGSEDEHDDPDNHAAFVLPSSLFAISDDGTAVEEVGGHGGKLTRSTAATTFNQSGKRARVAIYDNPGTVTTPVPPKAVYDVEAALHACVTDGSVIRSQAVASRQQLTGSELKKRGICVVASSRALVLDVET